MRAVRSSILPLSEDCDIHLQFIQILTILFALLYLFRSYICEGQFAPHNLSGCHCLSCHPEALRPQNPGPHTDQTGASLCICGWMDGGGCLYRSLDVSVCLFVSVSVCLFVCVYKVVIKRIDSIYFPVYTDDDESALDTSLPPRIIPT